MIQKYLIFSKEEIDNFLQKYQVNRYSIYPLEKYKKKDQICFYNSEQVTCSDLIFIKVKTRRSVRIKGQIEQNEHY